MTGKLTNSLWHLYRKCFVVSLDIDDFTFIAHAQKRQTERSKCCIRLNPSPDQFLWHQFLQCPAHVFVVVYLISNVERSTWNKRSEKD